MRNKTVIFVGGSSYSGSTLLDMVLSNTVEGFSCGELNALFFPYKTHHQHYDCGCGNKQCTLWNKVKFGGVSNAYSTIFGMFPYVSYIVDSSKDPLWIYDRTRELKSLGIETKNILIWKTPLDFFDSRKKRGRRLGWKRAWTNYQYLYFSLIEDWVAIPYKKLVTDPEALNNLSLYLNLPENENRIEYWHKEHHTLFGNTSAKVHLYNKKSGNFKTCTTELDELEPIRINDIKEVTTHRSIYYNNTSNRSTDRILSDSMSLIVSKLEHNDVCFQNPNNICNTQTKISNRLNYLYLAHRIKHLIRRITFNISMTLN